MVCKKIFLRNLNVKSFIKLLSLIGLFFELQSAWDWDDHPHTKKREEEALAHAFAHQVLMCLADLLIFP